MEQQLWLVYAQVPLSLQPILSHVAWARKQLSRSLYGSWFKLAIQKCQEGANHDFQSRTGIQVCHLFTISGWPVWTNQPSRASGTADFRQREEGGLGGARVHMPCSHCSFPTISVFISDGRGGSNIGCPVLEGGSLKLQAPLLGTPSGAPDSPYESQGSI